MEYHSILGERLEDQLKVVEWAKAEQKRILNEKGERLSKELREDDTIHFKSTKGIAFLYYHASFVLYCF